MSLCHYYRQVNINICTFDRAASTEVTEMHLTTSQRLMSVNQTLVSENLMLRNALKMLHTDIHHLLAKAIQFQASK